MNEIKSIIGYDRIEAELIHDATSTYAKTKLENAVMTTHLEVAKQKQQETYEAMQLLDANLHLPFMGLENIEKYTQMIEKGFILEVHELLEYADFLRSARLIAQFFQKHKLLAPYLASYSTLLGNFETVETEIYPLITNGQINDQASSTLRKIRQQIRDVSKNMQDKIEKFMRHPKNKDMIQEFVIMEKNGHYTVPVKSSYKRKINGTIISESTKGLTVFVEPDTIARLREEKEALTLEEINEVYQIQAYLTGLIHSQMDDILKSIECVVELEVIIARAKYSRRINGIPVQLNKQERIVFKNVKNPLLNNPVLLSLELDGATHRGLIITGSNAGGKTVVLKTVALMTYMACSGLLIPGDAGTTIAVMDNIFIEIGDNQSIERSLSTFSGHMHAMSIILKQAKRHTLVLLDEVGSGTEPSEGSALAIAILQTLYRKSSLVMATTHYGEVKRYGAEHPDFLTAAMQFNLAKLEPTYQLTMNETGDSQAFAIAHKMDLDQAIIDEAKQIVSTSQLPLQTHSFSPIKEVEETVTSTEPLYTKGDRVYSTMHKKEGLFYEDLPHKQQVKLYVDGTWLEVPYKRTKLKAKASDLYPENYDIDRLFMDYADYKFKHDVERGARNVWKNRNKN